MSRYSVVGTNQSVYDMPQRASVTVESHPNEYLEDGRRVVEKRIYELEPTIT